MNDRDPSPIIRPYRYAKGCVAAHCASVDGIKSRAARLAEAIGGRYVGRASGYVMTEAKARRLESLYRDGWDAGFISRELIAPKQ